MYQLYLLYSSTVHYSIRHLNRTETSCFRRLGAGASEFRTMEPDCVLLPLGHHQRSGARSGKDKFQKVSYKRRVVIVCKRDGPKWVMLTRMSHVQL
jgi:hypothetical protein